MGRGLKAEELGELELGLYTKPESVKRDLMVAGFSAEEVASAGLADAR